MTSTNATTSFAKQIVRIGSDELSDADRLQIRRLLLDYFGVSHLGMTLPWTRSLMDWAERYRASGSAPVVGSDLILAPDIAAFVNGTAAHGFSLDDTHEQGMCHPGAVVISAALAVAAESNATAERTFGAIAAGYDSMVRIGLASNAAKLVKRGFHPTALFGAFGAAAAAAILMGLDEAGVMRAWGHALSLSGGSMQFSDEPVGSTVKRLHAGLAARNGVLAAELSARGIEAPHSSLDGKYGFLALYSEAPELEQLTVKPSDGLHIHNTSFKLYASCRLFHPALDCLQQLSGSNIGSRADSINQIEVRGPAAMFNQHMGRRPASTMAAQYSLPFAVGAALIHGASSTNAFSEAKLNDPTILAIADRVSATPDSEFEALYPARMGSAVEIVFADGSRQGAKVLDCMGTPENPTTTEALVAKASDLLSQSEPEIDVEQIREVLWSDDFEGAALARVMAHGTV